MKLLRWWNWFKKICFTHLWDVWSYILLMNFMYHISTLRNTYEQTCTLYPCSNICLKDLATPVPWDSERQSLSVFKEMFGSVNLLPFEAFFSQSRSWQPSECASSKSPYSRSRKSNPVQLGSNKADGKEGNPWNMQYSCDHWCSLHTHFVLMPNKLGFLVSR